MTKKKKRKKADNNDGRPTNRKGTIVTDKKKQDGREWKNR